jgi:hypothetical protein
MIIDLHAKDDFPPTGCLIMKDIKYKLIAQTKKYHVAKDRWQNFTESGPF